MVFQYFRERLPLHVFGPIAAALALPAQAAAPFEAGRFIADTAFAFLLLAQFRLWDDLVDRDADAQRHPDRALVRARSISGPVALCVALGVLNAVVVWQRQRALIGAPLLGVVTAALMCVYSPAFWLRASAKQARSTPGLEGQRWQPALKDLLRLSKYPAFVMLVAVGRLGNSLQLASSAAVAAYAAACAYELWHDDTTTLRSLFRSPSCR
jgi:hypothetical protein